MSKEENPVVPLENAISEHSPKLIHKEDFF